MLSTPYLMIYADLSKYTTPFTPQKDSVTVSSNLVYPANSLIDALVYISFTILSNFLTIGKLRTN